MNKLNESVFQFKIALQVITPEIWRRIQVPADYNFWDLHIAIQDAMGWYDYHLHAFNLNKEFKTRMVKIGIPDELSEDFISGRKVKFLNILLRKAKKLSTLMILATTGCIQ